MHIHSRLTYRPKLHADKRKYLRTALRELVTVFTDKPGLMGPKVPLLTPLLTPKQALQPYLPSFHHTTTQFHYQTGL